MAATLLASLASQISLEAARKVFAHLSRDERYKERLLNAANLLKEGSSAIDALRKAFGPDFDSALTSAFGSPARFTYQQGMNDYIKLPLSASDNAVSVLHDELNINLERIARLCRNDADAARNYFLGVFQRWRGRYVEILGEDEDAANTFETINSLLDGSKKTFADALRLLQRTGLGAGGALLIVSGAMVVTSTGVGLWAWITTLLFGVPMTTVASLVIPGALLIALATVSFDFTNGMTASIGAAYKLLERRKSASAGKLGKSNPPKPRARLPAKSKVLTKAKSPPQASSLSPLIPKSGRSGTLVEKKARSTKKV